MAGQMAQPGPVAALGQGCQRRLVEHIAARQAFGAHGGVDCGSVRAHGGLSFSLGVNGAPQHLAANAA
jgi:hypothetical protein